MDPARDDNLMARYRTAMIICGAIVAAVPIYVAVAAVLSREGAEPTGAPPIVVSVLGAVALATFAAAAPMRGLLVRGVVAKAPAGSSADIVPAALLTGAILSYALCEAPAILGLAVFIMTGSWVYFLLFIALALVGFAMNFPRLSAWRARVELAEAADAGLTGPVGTS